MWTEDFLEQRSREDFYHSIHKLVDGEHCIKEVGYRRQTEKNKGYVL